MAIDNSRLALARIDVNHPIRCTIAVCVLASRDGRCARADSLDCHIGSYRLKDGELVDVAPSYNDRLRWRRSMERRRAAQDSKTESGPTPMVGPIARTERRSHFRIEERPHRFRSIPVGASRSM